MKELWAKINFSPTTFELPENNIDDEEKEDNMEGDRPVNKGKEVEKKEMPKAAREKLTGLQINNFPKDITDEEIVKFLKENVKADLDTVNFEYSNTEAKHNKSIYVFSGLNPEEIEAAVKKIDFKQSTQTFCKKPLYCKAMKNITPVKSNPNVGSENEQNREQENKDKQNDDLEDKMESEEGDAIAKPKFIDEEKKKVKQGSTSQSGKIEKYFTPARCQIKPLQSEFAEAVAKGDVPLDSPEPLGDKEDTEKRKAMESPGISPNSKPLPKKDKRTTGIPKGSQQSRGPK